MVIEPTWKALYGGGRDCPDGEQHRPVKRTGNTASCSRCDSVLILENERDRGRGCVTNFDHFDPRDGENPQRLTIWKQHGGRFTLSKFGALGARLPFSDDPLFQSLAAEIHRLACEVGRLRRLEIEQEREARRAEVPDGEDA